METEAGDRLAGNCHDRKQPATSCHYPFAIMASRLRHHAIIMVLMSAAVGMDVKLASIVLAAVIVNADVTFRNAAFSLPPQSDSTSIELAFLLSVFARTAVAAIALIPTATATAKATSHKRRFTNASSSGAA